MFLILNANFVNFRNNNKTFEILYNDDQFIKIKNPK
jgi:hypothetical protein